MTEHLVIVLSDSDSSEYEREASPEREQYTQSEVPSAQSKDHHDARVEVASTQKGEFTSTGLQMAERAILSANPGNGTGANDRSDNQTTPLAAAQTTDNGTTAMNNQTNSQTTPLVPSADVGTDNHFQWKHDLPRYDTDTETDHIALKASSIRAKARLTQNLENIEHGQLVGQDKTFANSPDLDIPQALLRGLADMNITKPTRVQKECVERQLAGCKDMIVRAPLGSGKMLAYLIPLVSFLSKAKKTTPHLHTDGGTRVAQPRGLIVVPTHELAIEVLGQLIDLCKYTTLRPCAVYGRAPMWGQRNQLRFGCDILVGTLGRLCHFAREPRTLWLGSVKTLIIDEADEMNSECWNEDFGKLFSTGLDIGSDMLSIWLLSSEYRQGGQSLEQKWLADGAVSINLRQEQDHGLEVTQDFVYCEKPDRVQELGNQILLRPPQRTLIIVNDIVAAEEVDSMFTQNGVVPAVIHGLLGQDVRETSKTDFDEGRTNFCVVTGALARGLNFNEVHLVILFDLPTMSQGGLDEYLVRIGRTGRMGYPGQTVAFVGRDDAELAVQLVPFLRTRAQQVPPYLQQAADRRP